MTRVFVCSVAILAAVFVPRIAPAQENVESRIKDLEHRMAREESSLRDRSDSGALMFLYGVFCALWAQNTGRNAWLWFFMGMLFSVITVVVLLVKNSEDRKRRWAWNEEPAG